MKNAVFLLSSALCALSASAAVTQRWTVETSRVQPASFDAVRGESIALEATLQSYGKAVEIPSNAHVSIYWQTNGMASAWWTADASVVGSNVLAAVFTPEMDVGAKAYNCYIGSAGTSYRAAFQLRFREGPGAVPNELPLPAKTIDFAKVTVTNDPWTARIEALEEGSGGIDTDAVRDIVREEVPDYETTSNRAAAAIAATNDFLRTGGGTVTGGLRVGGIFEILGGQAYLGGLIYGSNFFGNSFDSFSYSLNGYDFIFFDRVPASQDYTISIGTNKFFTKITGKTINLANETYVGGSLYPLSAVKVRIPENIVFRDLKINLIELIESYIHANEGSGLSVTDPSYSFVNQARTSTLSVPHIPTEDNPVTVPQGTLTYDGTNYWLNGETQYDRDIDGDVKASVTLDQQMLTNVVTAVKSHHYDETLGVTWKLVPDDGHIYFIAVTNANVVTQ